MLSLYEPCNSKLTCQANNLKEEIRTIRTSLAQAVTINHALKQSEENLEANLAQAEQQVKIEQFKNMDECSRSNSLEQQVARLREALGAFSSGGEWGKWLAWLVNGAPTRQEGIEAAKIIVHCQCCVDKVLAQAALAPEAGKA